MAKFRLRFNHYKCNAKLNGKRRRGFKQEKLIEPFFLLSHNRTHEDIKVQIIGHRDPKDQVAKKRRLLDFPSGQFAFKSFKSKTQIKILNKLIQYFNEHF